MTLAARPSTLAIETSPRDFIIQPATSLTRRFLEIELYRRKGYPYIVLNRKMGASSILHKQRLNPRLLQLLAGYRMEERLHPLGRRMGTYRATAGVAEAM